MHIGEAVVFSGTEPYDTYSEGIAWGMLLSVIMDNSLNDARAYFDGFNEYRKVYRNPRGLMNWHIGKNGVLKEAGIAVEADENMAMALVLAHHKWGSNSKQNYEKDAKEIINALMEYCVLSPEMFMKPGDTWGGYDLVHPCNFDVCFYNDWGLFTNDSRWFDVKKESYGILQRIYSRYPTGFLPHWCDYNGNKTTNKTEYFQDYNFEYDALQTAFKIALDYLLNGDKSNPLSFTIPNSLSNSIRKLSDNNPNNIATGYDLNGKLVNSSKGSSAFLGAFGVASMVSPEHQQWCNDLYTNIRNQKAGSSRGYYNDIIRLFSLIIMSGNFPQIEKNR